MIECRTVGADDAKSLAALFAQLDSTTFHPHPLSAREARRIAAYAGPDVYALLLEDGQPMAYGILRGWEAGHAVPSLGIAVRAGQRRRGLGRTLMGYLHEQAWQRGATSIRLRVRADNGPARRLYESLGYSPQGIERGEQVMVLTRTGTPEQRQSHRQRLPHTVVAIDARIVSGYAGGVETVLIGLASGLSRLPEGDEEYVFLAIDGATAWLEPHIHGACRILRLPASRAYLAGTRFPWARAAWRRLPVMPGMGVGGPPVSDGTVERLGTSVVHMVLQKGFRTAIPSIYNPHDLQHWHLPEFFTPREIQTRERRFQVLIEQARLVAVTSSWGRRDVLDHYRIPPDRVQVIPWAPVLSEYTDPSEKDLERVRETYALPSRFILYPAQTWPHKNHIALLEAMARLRDRDGTTVDLVAPGYQTAYVSKLRARAMELGLGDHVLWLGFVPAGDLRGLYQLARGVVIPTRFEAASGPLWEAFQAGTPAACSNVTSLPDQAGDAAIIFDADRPDEIADAIRTLWFDDHARSLMIERGKANIARFSWDLTARLYRAWYRRLAGREATAEDRALMDAPPLL